MNVTETYELIVRSKATFIIFLWNQQIHEIYLKLKIQTNLRL